MTASFAANRELLDAVYRQYRDNPETVDAT